MFTQVKSPTEKAHAEQAADWLLSGLELRSTLFHVGQYCGVYRASTAGHQRASFHLILQGQCWLHVPERGASPARSVQLHAGDAVFLLHDLPHCLSPDASAPAARQLTVRIGTMTPLQPDSPQSPTPDTGVGVACGFFDFRSDLGDSIYGLLPELILMRRGDPGMDGARAVFGLIREEAIRAGETASPLINRLTDVLFFYVLRAVASADSFAPGLWSVMRRSEFALLVNAIIERPGNDWTTVSMAAFCHMSRARFCKHFADVCGQPPAQFLALLRMKVAAEMLRHGVPTVHAAEHVGYRSESAFAQAFKRITGAQPGARRKEHAARAAPRAVVTH